MEHPLRLRNLSHDSFVEHLRMLFCRPGMYGVRNPIDFLHMLSTIEAFLAERTAREFFHNWYERLTSPATGEPVEMQLRQMQDDWFRARGLPLDDPELVQPVLQHRARWSGGPMVPPFPEADLPVEIAIEVHVNPIATCTECQALMAYRPEAELAWFWCPVCDEGVFFPVWNLLRDAERALHNPDFRMHAWKAKRSELPLEPPEFEFG